MSIRAATYQADVVRREQLSQHFVRLVLAGPGLARFATTGVPDEWVALTVPGQFQTRYYTVRSWGGGELVLDVVVHGHGLVTEWATRDCIGDTVTVSEPRGSFKMPAGAKWLLLVADLTGLPAAARIIETFPDLPVTAWVETPDEPIDGYVDADLIWSTPPPDTESATAAIVESIEWPPGVGYFWMAGESSQMRVIRKHLMRELRLPSASYDVMGYWRGGQARQLRAVDPGPIWVRGKAEGKSDDEIWADYDAAREAHR